MHLSGQSHGYKKVETRLQENKKIHTLIAEYLQSKMGLQVWFVPEGVQVP